MMAPLGYGLYIFAITYTKHGFALALIKSRGWIFLSLISFVIFLGLICYRLLLSRQFVAVHKNGIFLSLRKKYFVYWRQISGISTNLTQKRFLFLKSPITYKVVLHLRSGQSVHLSHTLDRLPVLITRIKANLYPPLLQGLKQKLNQGGTLQFGPLSIQKDSLSLNSHTYPWSQIPRVSVQSGKLVIELADHKRATIALARIPNFELLFQIMNLGDNP